MCRADHLETAAWQVGVENTHPKRSVFRNWDASDGTVNIDLSNPFQANVGHVALSEFFNTIGSIPDGQLPPTRCGKSRPVMTLRQSTEGSRDIRLGRNCAIMSIVISNAGDGRSRLNENRGSDSKSMVASASSPLPLQVPLIQ